MASSLSSSRRIISEKEAEEKYSCGICLNILDNACRPDVCKHIFCRSCLYNAYQESKKCPVCRLACNFSNTVTEKKINEEIRNLAINCAICSETVELKALQNHRILCNEDISPKPSGRQQTQPINNRTISSSSSQFNRISLNPSSRPTAGLNPTSSKGAINRYTFKCPYCDEANLTVDALINHCNQNHKEAPKRVVCPICKAMPWGDSNQMSANFISHLNMRHKFEYDRYVDFTLDDEEALSKAMQESLRVK